MSDGVLDSSAVLALLFAEPGSDKVKAFLPGGLLSTVNLTEVVSKLRERGMPSEAVFTAIEALGVEIVDFDFVQAAGAAELRLTTRHLGLSLGDRACLALAHVRRLPVVTADSAWAGVPDCDVRTIR